MSNAASTPEFKAILDDLYSSGKYRTSGEVLKEAWRVWRRDYGIESSPEQKRRYAERMSHGRNPRDFYIVIRTEDNQVIKTFQRKVNAEKLLRRLSAKDGVGSYFIERLSEWKKRNPKRRSTLRTYGDYPVKIHKKYGNEAGFVSNVILHQHPRAAQKLKGLWNLLEAGHEVRTGQEIDILLIDGNKAAWSDLEKAAKNNPRSKKWSHPVSARQQRWAFAAESRGELKPGTARKWSRRVKRKNPIAVYNPRHGVKLPATDIELRYIRTAGEWKGEPFKHPFKSSVSLIGLPDGNVLIKSNSGKRLWGKV